MRQSRVATFAMGIAVAAALTGCGDSDDGKGGSSDFADEKPADIVEAAKTAMGELESLKISGATTSGGQAASLDLQLSSSGDCIGTLTFDTTGKLEILGVGGDRWFKGDEDFWASTGIPDAAPVLGKWVIDAKDDFAQFCDIDDFVGEMFQDDSEETYTTKGTEELDGDDVVAIEQEDAEEGVSIGYVLVDEPHYMVKVENEGDEGGTISFSEFDEKFDVAAPSADEIVNLDDLS